MLIAIEGCAHGELEHIYETIQAIQVRDEVKIDLLLCCGDFQAARNFNDLLTMAVPRKYEKMCSFYKYYSGELQAPILTIFISGNHEASNYLQELPFGGWVAPNIYYMGYAGVCRVNGLRIMGLSGIYKQQNYTRGHFEFAPYTVSAKHSVYNIRNLEEFRLQQLSGHIDICLSHDWPKDITQFGDVQQLLRFKPFLQEDIKSGKLGSLPAKRLLHYLQPSYWFSAHLHCKFAALVPHLNKSNEEMHQRYTKFLALDKCLPQRRFLQILEIDAVPSSQDEEISVKDCKDNNSDTLQLEYDLEWLTILYLTKNLIHVKNTSVSMPCENNDNVRTNYTPTLEELNIVKEKFQNNLIIPKNFCQTAKPFNPDLDSVNMKEYNQPRAYKNVQTTEFCKKLGVDDPTTLAVLVARQKMEDYPQEVSPDDNIDKHKLDQNIIDKPIDSEVISIDYLLSDTEIDLLESKESANKT